MRSIFLSFSIPKQKVFTTCERVSIRCFGPVRICFFLLPLPTFLIGATLRRLLLDDLRSCLGPFWGWCFQDDLRAYPAFLVYWLLSGRALLADCRSCIHGRWTFLARDIWNWHQWAGGRARCVGDVERFRLFFNLSGPRRGRGRLRG